MTFTQMNLICFTLGIMATSLTLAIPMPYRRSYNNGISSKSMPPIPAALEEYINPYLQASQLQQQQQLLNQNQYYLPERKHPIYQEGYIQEQPPNIYEVCNNYLFYLF